MCATTRADVIAPRRERGATLIEGMVAILIFSIGILALMSLHALSIKNTTDAQYRSEASYLANGVLARIRLADPGTVVADFASPSGTQYTQWVTDVARHGRDSPDDRLHRPAGHGDAVLAGAER
jgi:type IV pilus assembly protein PilV